VAFYSIPKPGSVGLWLGSPPTGTRQSLRCIVVMCGNSRLHIDPDILPALSSLPPFTSLLRRLSLMFAHDRKSSSDSSDAALDPYLLNAVLRGDEEAVRQALTSGSDINSVLKDGRNVITALLTGKK
jgi:hypothetical protein